MQRYCYQWLLVFGVFHCAMGLGFIFFMTSPWAEHYLNQWRVAFDLSESDHGLVPALQFLGPTIASWGLMFCVALQGYWRTGERQLWWGMVVAVWVWLLADTSLSIWYGLHSHYLINGVAGALLLVPLWGLRSLPRP